MIKRGDTVRVNVNGLGIVEGTVVGADEKDCAVSIYREEIGGETLLFDINKVEKA